jgi:hypothetical protein
MQSNSKRSRRGLAVVEVSAASMVLVICFALLAQLLYLIARQERSAEIRGVAVRTAANQLEALLAKRFEDLEMHEQAEAAVPDELLRLAPSAILKTAVTASDDENSKQIRVDVAWRSAQGVLVSPVSLTAWKHRPATESQP